MSISKELHILILFIAVFFSLSSCSTTENASNRNVAGIYMSGINLLEPDYKVFHENDTLTSFYFRLKSEDLLYTKKRADSTFSANVEVSYELVDELEQIIDSSTIRYSDFGQHNEKKFLEGLISLKTKLNSTYSLIVSFYDVNRDNLLKKKISINRTSVHNSQNFIAKDDSGNIVYKNHLLPNFRVHLQKSLSNNYNSGKISYFHVKHPIAKPPFSEAEKNENIQLKSDSILTLDFDSLNTVEFTIDGTGFFLFQTNDDIKEGPAFFCFQNNFPEIGDLDNMIESMRYITTNEEYNGLLQAEDKKNAMDNFWLEIAGGSDRARTLIKEYFNRVEGANHYFTSYLEGWKTDRGLIYIIYGPPNIVYKSKDYENWIYGEENNVMSMNFVFYKSKNYLSNNDYILSRSAMYKNTWYRAVDTWRSGRIF